MATCVGRPCTCTFRSILERPDVQLTPDILGLDVLTGLEQDTFAVLYSPELLEVDTFSAV